MNNLLEIQYNAKREQLQHKGVFHSISTSPALTANLQQFDYSLQQSSSSVMFIFLIQIPPNIISALNVIVSLYDNNLVSAFTKLHVFDQEFKLCEPSIFTFFSFLCTSAVFTWSVYKLGYLEPRRLPTTLLRFKTLLQVACPLSSSKEKEKYYVQYPNSLIHFQQHIFGV